MRKHLLIFIPLLIIAQSAFAQPDIAAITVSAGFSGCARSASQNVIMLIQNIGTTDLSNVPFNLTYTINGGAPVSDVGISFANFGINVSQSHTFTVPANLSAPGVYSFTAYISGVVGDVDQTNDTAYTTVTNTSSVGGIVNSSDTVCVGVNGATLTLTGKTGNVVRWESSLNGINWTNIGNAGSTTLNYLNLGDTTFYRAIVKNGICAIDSSIFAKITVTPIPLLSSTLDTGTCSGSLFTYIPTSSVAGSTFAWSRDSVYHITPVSSSGTGNISETLFNDTSVFVNTYYNIVTTANNCTNSGETVVIRVDRYLPAPAGVISGIDSVCQSTFNFPYSTSALNPDTTAWYTWSYSGTGANRFSGGPPTPFKWTDTTGLFFSATASSGDLTVTGSNYCGNGPSSPAYTITVDTAALVDAAGPDSICQSSTPLPMALTGATVSGPASIVGTWSVLSGGGTLSTLTATNLPDTVTYTPLAGYAGNVVLLLTTNDPEGVCSFNSETRTIRIDTAAIPIAGGPDNLCQSPVASPMTLTGSSVVGPDSTVGTWSIVSGGGTLSTLTPTNMPDTVVYTPAINYAGIITLQLTTSDPGTACGVVIATRTITIDSLPTVSAGVDTTICASNSYTLSGTMGGGASTITWTTLGDGTFNDSSLLNAVYSPGVGDTTSGSVILIISTDDPAGPCTSAVDSVTITIDPAAFVGAGIDNTICAGNTFTLAGTVGGSTVTQTWTTSGDGIFNDSSLVNAVYTPGVTDTALGSVFLILTTNDPVGVCGPVVDTMLLTINTPAVVAAGVDSAVCAGNSYILSGMRSGGASASTWTTLGDGIFSDSSLVNSVYTPGPTDITNGTVILIISTDDPAGPCLVQADSMVLTIDSIPTVSAGVDDSICASGTYTLTGTIGGSATTSTWTTSGDGTFNDSSLVNAIYTPGIADSTSGNVYLILTTNDPIGACTAVVDSMLLLIRPPAEVTAGADGTICADATYTLAGSRFGGAATSTWTTTGDGMFSDSSLVNAVYTPGVTDIINGTVTLIITTDDPAGPCLAQADSMVLTIDSIATVTAGVDDSICASSSYTLTGTIGGSATSSTWTTSGDGTFNDSSLVNAVYTPGIADSTSGSVYLIITTNDPIGACSSVVDSMLLLIRPPAEVTAGADGTICSDTTYTLAGSRFGGAATSTWTTTGDGIFSNSSLVNAVYTPGLTDITNGIVTLIITSNDPVGPCTAATDSMTLTITLAAIANAGVDDTACLGSGYTLSGSIGGGATTSTWTTSGDGSFNNASLLNAVYTPGPNDISSGNVYLVLTTNDPAGPCNLVFDSLQLTIAPSPTLVISDPDAVCEPLTIDLTLPAVTSGSTPGLLFNYYTNAAATIHVADSTSITAAGTYYIVGRTSFGCTDTAAVNVVVNLAAVGGIASPDALVCSGSNSDTVTLTNYVGSIQQWQSSTDGGVTWVNIANTTPQQPYLNLTITTWYRAMLTATCASAVSEEARITVDPNPLSIGGTVTPNDTVCSGANNDTITLSGHLGTILRWEYSIDDGNTWVYINNTTSTHIYTNLTTTTIFHAVVQNNVCGPAVSSNDTITVTSFSDAGAILGATPGCQDQTSGTLVLNNYTGSVLGWQYSEDGGVTWTDTLNLNDSLIYTNLADTTIYTAIVQASGCIADTSVAATVIVYPKPVASFTADTVCAGAPTSFTNTSTVAAGTIQFSQWDFGDNTTSLTTNPMHTYPALGVYTANLIVITNFGCKDTATVNVITDTLPNAQISASGGLSFCCGGSVTLSGSPGFNYLWSAGGATTQSIVVNDCAGSGTYQLTISDPSGVCSNTASVAVVVFPLPAINAGNDTTINKGGSVVLNGQGGIVYSWSPVSDLSNPGSSNTIATPSVSTTYVLTGTDLNGCINSDSVTITVLTDLNDIIITNLLTTNGDGFNDNWIISDLENYPGTEVIIVNREGQQVYYSSSYDNSWDGTNKNGKPLPDGTYYYFIKFPNSGKVFKGPITILNEK